MNSTGPAHIHNGSSNCPHCGKKINSDWLLCPNCGNDLSPIRDNAKTETINPIRVPHNPSPKAAGPKTWLGNQKVILPAIILFLLIVMTTLWYSSTADDRLYEQARKYQTSGQYQEAIDVYDQFVRTYPSSPFTEAAQNGTVESYTSWAEALRQQSDFAGSIDRLKDLQKLTATTPDGSDINELIVSDYIEWGNALTAGNYFQEALDNFDTVIRDYANSEQVSDAENAAIETYIAWAHRDTADSDYDSAIKHLKLALSEYSTQPASETAKKELFDQYMARGDEQLTFAQSMDGNIADDLKIALQWYKEAVALNPFSVGANSKVFLLNKQSSLPIYAWRGNEIDISVPLSSEEILLLGDEIAVINATIESSRLQVRLGEDIQYSYETSATVSYNRTVKSIEYPVLVDRTQAGMYQVKIQADVYNVSSLRSFSPNLFLENQVVEFYIWIP